MARRRCAGVNKARVLFLCMVLAGPGAYIYLGSPTSLHSHHRRLGVGCLACCAFDNRCVASDINGYSMTTPALVLYNCKYSQRVDTKEVVFEDFLLEGLQVEYGSGVAIIGQVVAMEKHILSVQSMRHSDL